MTAHFYDSSSTNLDANLAFLLVSLENRPVFAMFIRFISPPSPLFLTLGRFEAGFNSPMLTSPSLPLRSLGLHFVDFPQFSLCRRASPVLPYAMY